MKRLSKAARAAIAACMAFAACGALAGCSSSEDYTPQLGSPKISSPAIGEDGTLRVGVNTNNSPLAGKSGERIIGIDVDIAAALADQLGLALEVVDVGNNGTDAIDGGEVDVVLGVDSTSKEDGYWMSSQYLPTGVVLFAPEGNDEPAPTADSDVKIAAQVSSKSAWAVTNTFGEDSLESASDLAAAFSDLGSGKVEYVASDAIIGMYAASRQDVKVAIAALLDTAGGYCALCSKDNTELQEALGAALDDLVANGAVDISGSAMTQISAALGAMGQAGRDLSASADHLGAALDDLVANGVVDVIEDKWLGQPVNLNGVPKIASNAPKSTNVEGGEEGAQEGGEGADADAEGSSGSSGSSSSSSASSSASSSSSRNAA